MVLTQHPAVEVLSRDRSTADKSGMTQGAPEALQVADRFDLVQNLTETLEKVLSSYDAQLKAIVHSSASGFSCNTDSCCES
ncbi:hypothetical protein DSM107010_33890 [Chroococcidiopsis cubana SAG 39.79]|uniref:Uncharacterized protein n=1 Tax=Chroococcidiopsis cubana SAG 39.79 TaxID=388085 RepID=A0AB37UIY7_9CYAN|nr:hypothetical protein C7B80_09760 [Cyanosarcina cf. burmensis CCALA 770]RUT11350.1 hypothetical protein DSM107010_33890 [Chroococcidiopsis cubana SAG 39.79]